MQNNLSSKKKRKINKSKQKASLREISSRKTIISSLNSPDKKELSVLILAIIKLKSKAKNIDIVMIGIKTYYTACCLKKA